jgi:hypothetical protein
VAWQSESMPSHRRAQHERSTRFAEAVHIQEEVTDGHSENSHCFGDAGHA